MKKLWKSAVALILTAGLTASLCTVTAAPSGPFSDIQGHWAQTTLQKAFNDGVMKGVSDTAMAPNDSVTKVQAVTMLCRILHVRTWGNISALGIPEGAWYESDAAHGLYLGLLDASDAGALDKPINRGDAFVLFAEAFQTGKAIPGREHLDAFADGASLTGKAASAAENLIAAGVVNGIDGKLLPGKSLTRAEFVTMLYRIADTFLPASDFKNQKGSGVILSGDAALNGVNTGNLWFEQTASSVSLSDTYAKQVVIRSDQLDSLTLSGSGSVSSLVLANSQGNVDLTIPDSFWVPTFVVGSGGGNVSVSGPLSSVEITGDGRTVAINNKPETLFISGSNNTVTLNNMGGTAGQIIITGDNNTLFINGKAKNLRIEARDNTVAGSGSVAVTDLLTRYANLEISSDTVNQWASYDLSGVSVSVQAPATLPAGEHLKATARLSVPEGDQGKICTGIWYLNDVKVQEEPIILGSGDPVSDIEVPYSHDLKQDAQLRYELTNINNDGETCTASGSASLYLETFSDLGLADADIQLSAPEYLAAGETLHVTASVSSPESGKVCEGIWTIDGKKVSEGAVTLGASTPYLTYDLEHYYGMPDSVQVTCRVRYTTEDGREQEIKDTAAVKVGHYEDNGIARAAIDLKAPDTVTFGSAMNASAEVTFLEAGKVCTGTWYLDGEVMDSKQITLGADAAPVFSHTFGDDEGDKESSELKFVLSYTTKDGRDQEVSASKTIALSHGPSDQEILSMVTSTYAGNYTLAWAQNNDYTPEVKTRWVNLQGYSSKSKYLIWVNLTYQRVNICEGSQGNWELIRTCLCGSGKPSTPTIKGVFAVTYKQNAWSYGSYYCGPVVRFYSGFAFHSRLEYWPMGSGRFYDARIGFPISHGCLRMYDDDIWFIYNNIPSGTTVVVH